MQRPAAHNVWFAVALLLAALLSVASVYRYLTEPPADQGVIRDR